MNNMVKENEMSEIIEFLHKTLNVTPAIFHCNLYYDDVKIIVETLDNQTSEITRLTSLADRLKEDAKRLATKYKFFNRDVSRLSYCRYCGFTEIKNLEKHSPDCPITLHNALMKELEVE